MLLIKTSHIAVIHRKPLNPVRSIWASALKSGTVVPVKSPRQIAYDAIVKRGITAAQAEPATNVAVMPIRRCD